MRENKAGEGFEGTYEEPLRFLWFFCEECWVAVSAKVEVPPKDTPKHCEKTMTYIGWFESVKLTPPA